MYFPKIPDIVKAHGNISKIMRYTMLQRNEFLVEIFGHFD